MSFLPTCKCGHITGLDALVASFAGNVSDPNPSRPCLATTSQVDDLDASYNPYFDEEIDDDDDDANDARDDESDEDGMLRGGDAPPGADDAGHHSSPSGKGLHKRLLKRELSSSPGLAVPDNELSSGYRSVMSDEEFDRLEKLEQQFIMRRRNNKRLRHLVQGGYPLSSSAPGAQNGVASAGSHPARGSLSTSGRVGGSSMVHPPASSRFPSSHENLPIPSSIMTLSTAAYRALSTSVIDDRLLPSFKYLRNMWYDEQDRQAGSSHEESAAMFGDISSDADASWGEAGLPSSPLRIPLKVVSPPVPCAPSSSRLCCAYQSPDSPCGTLDCGSSSGFDGGQMHECLHCLTPFCQRHFDAHFGEEERSKEAENESLTNIPCYLSVTHDISGLIYCHKCRDVIHHPMFDSERSSIHLQRTMGMELKFLLQPADAQLESLRKSLTSLVAKSRQSKADQILSSRLLRRTLLSLPPSLFPPSGDPSSATLSALQAHTILRNSAMQLTVERLMLFSGTLLDDKLTSIAVPSFVTCGVGEYFPPEFGGDATSPSTMERSVVIALCKREDDINQFVRDQEAVVDPELGWSRVQSEWPSLSGARKSDRKWKIQAPVGLYNLGNTCFMSCGLQCLASCRLLQKFFLRDHKHDHQCCECLRSMAPVQTFRASSLNPHQLNGLGDSSNADARGRVSPPSGVAAATLKRSGQSSGTESVPGDQCMACELDRMFIEMFGSSAGIDVMGGLTSLRSRVLRVSSSANGGKEGRAQSLLQQSSDSLLSISAGNPSASTGAPENSASEALSNPVRVADVDAVSADQGTTFSALTAPGRVSPALGGTVPPQYLLPLAPPGVIQGFPVSPHRLLHSSWSSRTMSHLSGYKQHDAHEFLTALLDTVSKHIRAHARDLKHLGGTAGGSGTTTDDAAESDVIKESFQGELRSTLMCSSCGTKRSVSETFLNISLQIGSVDGKADKISPVNVPVSPPTGGRPKNILRPKSALEPTVLDESLHRFTSPESLCDMVSCSTCNAMRPFKKQLTISKLPTVLCLHLKRFDSKTNKKIVNPVRYPVTDLDMGKFLSHWREIDNSDPVLMNSTASEREFCEDLFESSGDDQGSENTSSSNVPNNAFSNHPKVLYDLFGVVNHTGSLHQGHYVSIVKGNPLTGLSPM